MIIAALRELSILDLSYLSGATDSVVISLSTALPKLASLMLRGCNKIGNAAAQALFTNASNLNYLDISGILLINNGAFQVILFILCTKVRIQSLLFFKTNLIRLKLRLRQKTFR